MPWLPTNYGPGPGEIAAHAGITSGGHYTPQRNQLLEALKTSAPALYEVLKKRRNDEIANVLMNLEQPPRAEAVDPALQGAPATRPFTGGAEGAQAYQLYQKHLRADEDQAMQRQLNDARIQHLNAPRVMGQRADEGNGAMSAYQRELLRLREMDIRRKAGRYGTPLEDDPVTVTPVPERYPDTQGPDTPANGATPNPVQVLDEARAAIKAGKDPVAVKKRLAEMGIDATGL